MQTYALTHEAVKALMMDCLFSEKDFPPNTVPDNAVKADGIVHDYGFDPAKLAANTDKIKALLPEIGIEFFPESEGGWGGMSFLRLPLRRDGSQWGDQPMAECLYCLAAAIGHARFIMPREFWSVMPGHVPYILFSTAALPATLEA